MIDIHSHILPGLDDGARSIEQSIKMFHIAAQEGIASIIATPHSYGHQRNASPEKIRESFLQVQNRLQQEKIPIHLFLGNEIYYRQGVEEELECGMVHTLAQSRYVLVEFHPGEDYQYISRALSSIGRYGFYPILAHVERYENLFMKKGRLEDLKNCGVFFQANASSITAKGWSDLYRKRVFKLIKEQLVDYVATDAHSDGHRAPKMKLCKEILEKKAGCAYTHKLLIDNAEKILKCDKKADT